MKAIKITEEIKNTNKELFSNIETGGIRTFGTIPNSFNSLNYNAGMRTDGYHLLDNSIHEQDGFFELITPEITENQKLGSIYFDEENRVFTYQIEPKTPEEIAAEYQATIPQTVSQRQLRTQLVMTGFVLSDIQTAIETLPEPNKSIAQIAWDYAVTFERESPLLVSLALMLGLSEVDLDNIFINASQL